MKLLKIALAAAFLLAGVAYANEPGAGSTASDQVQAAKQVSKPKVKKHRPEAREGAKKAKPAKAVKAEVKESWTCSMHHDIHMDHAGKCPKCGMDLVKEAPQAKP